MSFDKRLFHRSPLRLVVVTLIAACGNDDRAQIEARLAEAAEETTEIVTLADVEALPAPVARYLRRAGVVGKPRTRAMRGRGEAEILQNGRWLALAFEHYLTPGRALSRDWIAETAESSVAATSLVVHDSYAEGRGRMSIRFFDDVPFQEQHGDAMDQAELVTLLCELMHAPSAFLRPGLALVENADGSVTATLGDRGRQASATFYFDAHDDLVRATSEDRYEAVDGEMVQTPWTATCHDHGVTDGVRVCVEVSAAWEHDGVFEAYVRGRYRGVELDVFHTY